MTKRQTEVQASALQELSVLGDKVPAVGNRNVEVTEPRDDPLSLPWCALETRVLKMKNLLVRRPGPAPSGPSAP